MSYQVIARKYRPQRFSGVVGQEHVTQTLAHAIEQNRIAHAYLFCGPRGTGKTTIARIFAKCLNATGGPRVDFDDNDPRCREIAEGRSLDVLEIDAASNRGIDEIRGLRETVRYVPAASKFKVYIIDEVHMLTKEAFNALLKTLEEPPEHVKFMFATTEPEKILPTILSRCQRFDLRRIPAALIVKHLEEIARQEEVKVEPAALYAMARGAEGAMRDAQSALDQLISFCGDKIQEADVLSMFGLTAQKQLLDLSGAVLAGDVEGALRQLNDLAGHGKDLARLLADLLNHFRNLLIFQVSRGDLSLLEVAEAEGAALAVQAKLAGAEGLTRILEVLGDADLRLRDTSSKKILIEVALLKAIEARNAVSLDTVLKRLEELRAESSGGEVVSLPPLGPAPTPERRLQPAAGRQAAPASERRLQPAAGSQTAAATPRVAAPYSSGPTSEPVSMRSEAAAEAGRQNATATGTTAGLPSEGGAPGDLAQRFASLHEAVDRPSPEAAASPALPGLKPQPAPKNLAAPPAAAVAPTKAKPTAVPVTQEDFKNDPLIRKALEIFKGQIVEVRA